ncbi:MAG TPA: hypothetical protein VMC82_03665 [Thermoplasmata archaeon]|nr:hypothetical protein [Thermoplasmata archaeon]
MSWREPLRGGASAVGVVPAFAVGGIRASGETPLQLTEPLLWVMLALTVAGAIVTYAFLVYAVWKFRDPTMRGRRHG